MSVGSIRRLHVVALAIGVVLAAPGAAVAPEPAPSQEANQGEPLPTLERRLLGLLGEDGALDRAALENSIAEAWEALAAGDARGVRPWLAGVLLRARGLDPKDAAAPLMGLDPQMRAYLAQPLAQLALTYGSQPEAAEVLSYLAQSAERWQVGTRCSSVMAQLQVARGEFADALRWCERGEELVNAQPEGRAQDLYRCEIAGRRFETALALGLIDQASRSLEVERQLAAQLVQDENESYSAAGRAYALTAEIHGMDLDLARQLFSRVARRCEKRLADATDESKGRSLFLLRHSAALAELVREDAERWQGPARSALIELLEQPLGPGPERRATLIRALDVAGDHASAEAWLAELRGDHRRGALSLQERSDLALIEVQRAGEAELVVAEAALDRVHAEWLRAWRDVPPPTGGLGFLEFARRRRVVASLVGARLGLDPGPAGVRRALEVVFREQGLGSLTRELQSAGRSPSSLDGALDALVGPDRALLVYVWGRDQGWLLLVDESGAQSAPLAAPRVVEKLRRNLPAHTVADSTVAGTLTALSALLLPAELRPRMQRSRLWHVAGLELVGQLPFGRLDDGRGPLGTTTALCSVPSLGIAEQLSRRRSEPPSSRPHRETSVPAVLLVTAPRVPVDIAKEQQLDPIPWSPPEHEALLGEPSEASQALTAELATHSQLLRADPQHFDVLHLVCHGAAPESDGRVGLWLAPDAAHPRGRVSYADLERLRSPELVVLSVCGAGRSATRRGDDAYAHLGGAFLKGGATAVILSPEPVLYATVREWSPRFRAALADGANPAEALRLARAQLTGAALNDALAWQLIGLSPR